MVLLRSWIAIIIAVLNFNAIISTAVTAKTPTTATFKKSARSQYFRHLKQKEKQDSISSSTASVLSYYNDESEKNTDSSLSSNYSTPSPTEKQEEEKEQQQEMTNQDKVEEPILLEKETESSSLSSPRSELESAALTTVASTTIVEAEAVEAKVVETEAELVPVATPTATPKPKPKPTPTPTAKPTIPEYIELSSGTLVMAYCENTLGRVAQINFENLTGTHLRRAIMEQHLKAKPLSPLTDVRVQVDMNTQYLQENKKIDDTDTANKYQLLITFEAVIFFRSILPYYEGNTSTDSIVSMIRNGFDDDDRRITYINSLQKIDDSSFDQIEQIKLIELNGESLSYDDTENKNKSPKDEFYQKQDLISQIITKNEQDPSQSSSSASQLGIEQGQSPQSGVGVGIQQKYPDIQIWIIIGSLAGAVALISLTLIVNLKIQGLSGILLSGNQGKLDGNSTSAGSNNSSSSASPSGSRLSSVVDSAPEILVQNSGDEISTLGDTFMCGGFRNDDKRMDEGTASIGNDYDYLEYAMKMEHKQTGAGIGGSIRSTASSTITDNNHKSNSTRLSYLSSDDYTRNTTSDESLGANLRKQMMNNQSAGAGALYFEEDDLSLEEQYNY